jgi:RNA 2',3'-cyclic 3'-phosphodiesterase
MRLFVALDIDAAIRERITAFRNRLRPLAPDVRWVGPETFHITLQFLGETQELDEIRHALQTVHGAPISLAFRGAGFFPHANAPRVFWVGIESDSKLQTLVTGLARALAPLGFERDTGAFTPHLTLARSGSGRPRPVRGERPASGLQRVAERLAKSPQPDFDTMTAHEFFLYQSHLSSAGPRYEKLATYSLKPSLTTTNNELP